MNRQEAIETILSQTHPSDVIVATTGLISREVYEKFDSTRNFYVPGSMGLASSIGLGLAVSCPSKRVVVIDGDASVLMNLGALVTIGHAKPVNLLHIVLDNNAYGSCSEEKSMSESAHLEKIALTSGYRYVRVACSGASLKRAMMKFEQGSGFILAKIVLGGRRDFRRPLELTTIRDRLMEFLSRSSQGEQP